MFSVVWILNKVKLKKQKRRYSKAYGQHVITKHMYIATSVQNKCCHPDGDFKQYVYRLQ